MIPLFRLLREAEVQMDSGITAMSRDKKDHKKREVCEYQMELEFEESQSS